MTKRKGQARTAVEPAENTSTSIGSSHSYLIAAAEVLNGANWQSDHVFSSKAITRLFGSMEWWQDQIDMCQLAVETLQDRLTDFSKILSDHVISNRPEQAEILESMIEMSKVQLTSYKEWEDICIGQMKKIGMRKRAPSAGGLPLG